MQKSVGVAQTVRRSAFFTCQTSSPPTSSLPVTLSEVLFLPRFQLSPFPSPPPPPTGMPAATAAATDPGMLAETLAEPFHMTWDVRCRGAAPVEDGALAAPSRVGDVDDGGAPMGPFGTAELVKVSVSLFRAQLPTKLRV